ncbi:MAG: tyrosine-type recombinase/integrase [Flavipsychrobacter sp.]|nr:tyrosine-type recombinase/integrase [Flavipsychrobacter sp.]
MKHECGVGNEEKWKQVWVRQVFLSGMHHRGADRIALYFPDDRNLLAILRPLGIQWSRTHRCWYGPMSAVWYRRLEELVAGRLELDRQALDLYLQKKVIPDELQEAIRAASNEKPEGVVEPLPVVQEKRSYQPKSRLSLENSQALEATRRELILKAYSPSTIRTYINELGVYLQTLGMHRADELTADRIKDYLAYCFTELKLSEHTIHSRINALKFYYEQVLKREKMFFEISRPKKPSQLPKLLNEDELARLFNALENRKHKAMLFTIYSAGLRVSELVRLKLGDIDANRMQLFVERAKGKKDRYVNLSPVLLDILRKYIQLLGKRPKEYLFESEQTGTAYSTRTVQDIFHQAKQRAGIMKEVGVHSLRHSFATHLLDKGVDIRYIKDLLGHFNIKTTERYLHVSKKQLVNIISPFDDLIRRGSVEW